MTTRPTATAANGAVWTSAIHPFEISNFAITMANYTTQKMGSIDAAVVASQTLARTITLDTLRGDDRATPSLLRSNMFVDDVVTRPTTKMNT